MISSTIRLLYFGILQTTQAAFTQLWPSAPGIPDVSCDWIQNVDRNTGCISTVQFGGGWLRNPALVDTWFIHVCPII